MLPLEDTFGRRFSYLRLSVTEACNFRCVYCLPNGYQAGAASAGFLSLPEIKNLVHAFAGLGTKKVRLTGGEPTLRPDFFEIAQVIRSVPGIEQLALSTNGFRLKELAPHLRNAGFTSLNVSVDTPVEGDFRAITGSGRLPQIQEGIEAALQGGFREVKLNAVLMRDWLDGALAGFRAWVRERPVAVRFIELMRTGDNQELFRRQHVSAVVVRDHLQAEGWRERPRGAHDGPAVEFEHPLYRGRFGLIAPYGKDFCVSCNRLRVTSRGALRLCLFGSGDADLRDLLRAPSQQEALEERLRDLVRGKKVSHFLQEGDYGNNFGFSAIGG